MIKKNLFSQEIANHIENCLTSADFPWYWNKYVAYENNENSSIKDFFFTHIFFRDGIVKSENIKLIEPILYEIHKMGLYKIKDIFRIQANLFCNSDLDEEELKTLVHADLPDENYISVVYYVNDSDGDTILYKDDGTIQETCSPVKNTIFWFPANQLHRPTPPKENKIRIVVNIVFEVE